MVKFDESIDIVLLSETNSAEFRKLYYSFKAGGVKVIPLVMQDDGFLPDDFVSIVSYFLEDDFSELKEKKPCYFNQIEVPDLWEISANNSGGTIKDLTRDRAKIHYTEPSHLRNVSSVDWMDHRGVVRLTAHYNSYGKVFAHTYYNKNGQRISKIFHDAKGRDCLYINYATGDYMLTSSSGKNVIFHSQMDFVKYFFEQSGLESKKLYFNSLSYPFFASEMLASKHKDDVLFWNEPIGDEIPGNMRGILNKSANRCQKVYVSRSDAYDKLISLGASTEVVQKLGYVYPFAKENKGSYQALICTNSDQVEQLSKIVAELPMIHFHVCALTEMSSKLLAVGSFENVNTYPGVKQTVLDDLYKKCDFYLDINHGNEIVNAVYQAFLYNHLIIAFEETAHQPRFVSPSNTYKVADSDQLIQDLNNCLLDSNMLSERLKEQRKNALSEDKLTFADLFSH